LHNLKYSKPINSFFVILAKAGIQRDFIKSSLLDSRLRGNDKFSLGNEKFSFNTTQLSTFMKKNSSQKIRLGVNIDHVATIRNARGGSHPDPVDAAILAQKSGAHGITIHLREDRRHIRDEDLVRLKKEIKLPINLEMAATEEMLAIALKTKPNAVCIVPEKRQEVTTEGGLDVVKNSKILSEMIKKLRAKKIRVSLFIDADEKQIHESKKIGADIVELHTGEFCHQKGNKQKAEFLRIEKSAQLADSLGLECHAGHGLNYETAKIISKIPQIIELNIGHFLIGEAVFEGLSKVIKKMQKVIKRP
jgi:pyridoxine 5-phosphate synthase